MTKEDTVIYTDEFVYPCMTEINTTFYQIMLVHLSSTSWSQTRSGIGKATSEEVVPSGYNQVLLGLFLYDYT